MKAFVFILICCMSTTGAFSQINYSARFSPTDFQIADTLAGDNVTYSYFTKNPFSSVETCGQPMLPVKYQHFIIPYGMKIDSITFALADTLHENLNNFLFPAQYPVATCVGCPKPPFCNIDSAIYFASTSYPIENVTPAGQGYWHTANIVTVAVYPYQYLPVSNKIIFSGTINFTIWFSLPAGSSSFPYSKKMRKSKYENFVSSLNHLVSNSINISQYLTGIEVADILPISVDPPNNEYIVIAPKEFAITEAMEIFVDWKKKRGIDIKVITIEEVYAYTEANSIQVDDIGNNSTNAPNSYSIAGNAAKLRKYLTRVDSLGGAQWILLIGDNSKLTIQNYSAKLDQQLFGLRDVITDKYFADFTSDYNVDGDTKLGEFRYISSGWQGDNVDVFPEAYLGRIPCSSTSEFQIWVNKLLNYETDPGNGSPEYLKSFVMTMADEMQNSLQNNAQLMNNLNIFQPLNIYKEVDDWNDPEPTAPLGSVIISALNTSPSGWWTWSNHGSISSFATMTNGDNSGNTYGGSISSGSGSNGLLSMTNTNKYGIFHSGNCDVAFFPSPTSMVKAALFNPHGGSVAFSGNTSLGWIDCENPKLINLTAIIKSCHNNNNLYNKNLCVADWNSYSYAGALNETQYETYLTHNYFGDPEMMYYTKAPMRLDAVVTPRHIDKTALINLSVTIKNLAYGHKVDVNLYQPDNILLEAFVHKHEVTGEQGNVTTVFEIPANLLTEGTLYVTISGFNYLPYVDDVLVSPGCSKQAAPNDKLIIATTPAFPWAGTKFINQDVIIQSPATLTITGEVYFVPEAKLIVEPGAKLIIDGGRLGTSCEELWKGVEIWGQSNLTQYSNVNQGFIQVTNNGSINDAICAISTAKPTTNGFVAGTSGGMFSCTNARFLNNKCSIHVYPYQLQNDNYNSNISRTSFTLDDKYIGEPDGSPMVLLDGIKGLGLSGLTFANSRPPGGTPVSRGIGIKAINSGFRLNQICTNANQQPCTEYIKPSFTGLFYGIHCLSTSTAKFVQVEHTDFIANDRGIYLSAVLNPSITQCYFKTKTGTGILSASGLYLNGCTGYSVQENTFEGNYSGSTLTYETGIVINNSGATPNEIYNNTFTGLQNGILAQNQNRDASGEYGLILKCNDFFNPNKYDIAVTKDNLNSGNGIKRIQGVDGSQTTDPAGNTFSYTHQNSESDYHNECENITYIYHSLSNGFNVNPVNHTPQPVISTIPTTDESYSFSKSNSCPSHLDNGGGGISQLKLQQDGAEALISNFTGQLLNLKDGGNTAELKEDIAYSIPPEALALYNSLISKSPYLSDTVLVEAIGKEEVLPSAMVTDILVANPQSAKSSEVNEALDSRTSLLSDEQREDVDQGVFVLSAFESLQSKLSDALAQRAQVQYAIVNHYMGDSTGTDSLKLFLAAQPDLWAKQLLLMQYVADADTMAAGALIQSINNSGLNLPQQAEWDDLTAYYNLCKYIAANENRIPDSLQQIALTELATRNTIAGAYARNLMVNQGLIEYYEPYIFPDDNLKSGKVIRRKQLTNESKFQFKLFPNPASNYFIVEYELGQTLSSLLITITDELGQLILSISPSGFSGFQVISLSDIAPGVYLVRFNSGNKILKESKLVVVR